MAAMKQKKNFSVYLSGFIVGMIAGALLWNLLLAGKVDGLYKRSRYLESSVEDYKTKLEKLEKSQTELEKEPTLKNIVVEIGLEDELERMVLEQAVKQKYDMLLGKKIKEIDLDLVIQVVDNRIFRTDQYQYQLHVDRLTLTSTLVLWISVKEIT